MNCLWCDKPVEEHRRYCSVKCQAAERNADAVDRWLKGTNPGHTGRTAKVKPFVRDYLIKLHGEQCSLCGWDKRNPVTDRVPLEVDHIDGNATNSIVSNLQLLCPNCHALTPNFRNLNKGKGQRIR